MVLGWLGIVILSITGVLLTISRIPTWEAFFSTRFGILLGLKILLFPIMVTTAVIVTFIIGPKLRKQKGSLLPENKDRLTLEELSRFDGRDGKPAYFAYKGKVYDVSLSKFWRDGSHMKKHPAGNDLTEMIKTAPHGEEKIFQSPQVAELLLTGAKREKSTHEKIFYFMAYMNLIFVFLITFIIALWRWW
ncbi:MAG: cytochrome b5 domain-containing protein [Thermodesulfobacteriota bacterium]|nr:cytochrome b5 domain-containing protein [Thermodesulfobacteriota bacterium]